MWTFCNIFLKNIFFCARLEGGFSVGKCLKFLIDGDRVGGLEQVAYVGSFETTFTGSISFLGQHVNLFAKIGQLHSSFRSWYT